MATGDEAEVASGPGGGDGLPDGENGEERDDAHLADLADGCGCAEVWEHLSGERDG